jgi:lipoprotein-anchoring transpeptidase ErfK/SrfK
LTITVAAILAAIVLQQPPTAASEPVPKALATQVMLDRAGFSPGPIDGRAGKNTRRALEAFEQNGGKEELDQDAAVTSYTITPEDAQGLFVPSIPEDMVEKSKLPTLGYTSVAELLAERFHATPALLEQLNRGIAFEAGATIRVPNVEPLALPVESSTLPAVQGDVRPQQGGAKKPAATGTSGRTGSPSNAAASLPDVVVTVKESTSDLTVTDPAGRVVLYAPVTTGSQNDRLPIGEWKVKGVQFSPKFHYNPELFWDADPAHSKAVLPSGPNNPVGLVWIDLSKPHYGIHGTPEPSAIGRSESHGCIRMTNWDALRLAGMVKPGTRVVFTK